MLLPRPVRQMRKQRPGKIRELAQGPSGSGGSRTVTDLFYLSPHVPQGLSCQLGRAVTFSLLQGWGASLSSCVSEFLPSTGSCRAGFVLVAQLSYFTVLLQVEIVPATVLEAL